MTSHHPLVCNVIKFGDSSLMVGYIMHMGQASQDGIFLSYAAAVISGNQFYIGILWVVYIYIQQLEASPP